MNPHRSLQTQMEEMPRALPISHLCEQPKRILRLVNGEIETVKWPQGKRIQFKVPKLSGASR